MGVIRIVTPPDLTTVVAEDSVAEERKSYLSADELATERRSYFPRDGGSLELFEIAIRPNSVVQTHAHSLDEVIYITAGEIHVGRRVLPVGSALFVEKDTLYGFRAGPQGCSFLNFRPTAGAIYYTREALALKKASV